MEDKDIITVFSNTLKEIRQKQSLSQEKLAFKAGLHPTYISLLETGKRQPSLSVIFRIAKELGCRPSEFIKSVEIGLKL